MFPFLFSPGVEFPRIKSRIQRLIRPIEGSNILIDGTHTHEKKKKEKTKSYIAIIRQMLTAAAWLCAELRDFTKQLRSFQIDIFPSYIYNGRYCMTPWFDRRGSSAITVFFFFFPLRCFCCSAVASPKRLDSTVALYNYYTTNSVPSRLLLGQVQIEKEKREKVYSCCHRFKANAYITSTASYTRPLFFFPARCLSIVATGHQQATHVRYMFSYPTSFYLFLGYFLRGEEKRQNWLFLYNLAFVDNGPFYRVRFNSGIY